MEKGSTFAVVATIILISVVVIFFTLYFAQAAFKEMISCQTKIEAIFNGIDYKYLKNF